MLQLVVLAFGAAILPSVAAEVGPVAPMARVALFNGRDLSGWHASLKGHAPGEDPTGVFTVKDGELRVSGGENGALITDAAWRDYQLTVEYRWTGTGPGAEKGRCGDSGILLHVRGDEQAFCGAWPVSFECNLILGKTGDLCLLGPKTATNDLKCLSWLDERGSWDDWKGHWKRLTVGNRVNASSNRLDWKGLKGQLANPPERPEGEWNRLEITARGSTMAIALNGKRITAAIDLYPAGGRIGLQSVGHGIAFRKVELTPLSACEPANVPPLLTTDAGAPVADVAAWENTRRPELVETFTSRMYGRRDVERPPELTFTTTAPDKVMLDGKAVRRRVDIGWKGPYGAMSFGVTAFIPVSDKPVPAFVLICNRDPKKNLDPERIEKSPFWPVEEIVGRGYAAIAFFNGDVAWDKYNGMNAFTNGVYACFRQKDDRTGESWGALTAWAWGASRVMDWIETEGRLDARHVGVVGHSRGGKAALCAGAFDARFAMTCSNDSGCGGAKLNHIDLLAAEHFNQITTSVPYWFCADFQAKCAGRDAELNFDQHQFLALMAPRLLYVASAAEDSWAGPEGEYWAARLASPAWELYGKRGLVSTGFPAIGTSLQDGSVAYHRREGGHNLTVVDWNLFMDFADRNGWRGR